MSPPGFTRRALAHRSFMIGGVLTLSGLALLLHARSRG